MADTQLTFTAQVKPLTTLDAAGLTAAIDPRLGWQPALLIETNYGVAETQAISGLAAAADMLLCYVTTPSPMLGYVFYPLRLRVSVYMGVENLALKSFFEAAYIANNGSLVDPSDPSVDAPWAYTTHTALPAEFGFNSGGGFTVQSFTPSFSGHFPPKLKTQEDVGAVGRALGSILLTVDTYDATVAGNAGAAMDGAWLAFPESVLNSAGFYGPRAFFNPY